MSINRVVFRVFGETGQHVDPAKGFDVNLVAEQGETMKDITKRLNDMTDGAIYNVKQVFHKAA